MSQSLSMVHSYCSLLKKKIAFKCIGDLVSTWYIPLELKKSLNNKKHQEMGLDIEITVDITLLLSEIYRNQRIP